MDQLSQIRAIVDRLAGRPGVSLPFPAELDEPWRTIYTRVHKAGDFSGAEQQLCDAASDLPGGDSLAREIADLIPSGDIFAAYPSLLDMDACFPPVSWLWPSWIPRRMLTILAPPPAAPSPAGSSTWAAATTTPTSGGRSSFLPNRISRDSTPGP